MIQITISRDEWEIIRRSLVVAGTEAEAGAATRSDALAASQPYDDLLDKLDDQIERRRKTTLLFDQDRIREAEWSRQNGGL